MSSLSIQVWERKPGKWRDTPINISISEREEEDVLTLARILSSIRNDTCYGDVRILNSQGTLVAQYGYGKRIQ
jgi:hypothetical protein